MFTFNKDDMVLLPLDFESSASTNSAIPASTTRLYHIYYHFSIKFLKNNDIINKEVN